MEMSCTNLVYWAAPEFQQPSCSTQDCQEHHKVVTSGTLPPIPPVVRDIVLYRLKFAESPSRLMSPLSKDETGYESSAFHPKKPVLAVHVTGAAFISLPFQEHHIGHSR